MRKNPTHEEYLMWEALRGRRCLNLKFRRQHPLNAYIADFYCHELNLVIELDGKYHEQAGQIAKDRKRTEDLNGINIIVYRITNEEFTNRNQTIEKLHQFLMTLKSPSP
jgi:very-short-patch-repair endonuclease